MEPELNCSSQCDSSLCFIQSGVSRKEGLDILQRLCGLSTVISCYAQMYMCIYSVNTHTGKPTGDLSKKTKQVKVVCSFKGASKKSIV